MAQLNYSDLSRQTQDALINFLRTDTEVAATFCDLAKATKDLGARKMLWNDVRKAVAAIRRLSLKVTDSEIRGEIERKCAGLEDRLSSQLTTHAETDL